MRSRAGITLALAALTVALYLPVRGFEWLSFDDARYVLENPIVRAPPGVASARLAFSSLPEPNWIPLTWLSLQLDHQLFGFDAGAFHLVNAALHALSTALLFLALVRMTGAQGRSAFVAGVFAWHPLHVESVAWIVERKDVLSGLFFMLTLHAHAHHAAHPSSRGRYALVLLWLALGLLAKPILVTVPGVLLLLDAWPLGRLRDAGGRRRALLEKLPMLALAAAASAAAILAQRGAEAVSSAEALPLAARVANALDAAVAYVGQSLWPSGLAAIYPHPYWTGTPTHAARSALLLAAATALCLRSARTRPHLAVGWLWYLLMLVPVIGLVQVGLQARADRYTYLPLIGLAIAVAWEAVRLAGGSPAARAALAAMGTAVLAALAVATRVQLPHWRDSIAVFERALAATEHNFIAHRALANEQIRAGHLDAAAQELEMALAILPQWPTAHRELGRVRAALGDPTAAAPHLERALAASPADTELRIELGLALVGTGDLARARSELAAAEARGASSLELHATLAHVEGLLGNCAGAIRHGRRALAIDPLLAAAANDLAWTLATCADARERSPAEAVRLAEAAEQRTDNPGPDLLDTLAAAYAAAGRFPEARGAASRAEAAARARGLDELAHEVRARATLYREGRPFAQPATPAPEAPVERRAGAAEASP